MSRFRMFFRVLPGNCCDQYLFRHTPLRENSVEMENGAE